MPLASVGGLISGLDTETLINQLMQVEAMPQTLLKDRVSTEQTAVNALQAVNAKLAGIATKAEELAKASAWSPLTATSSSDKAIVTTTPTATAGSLSFTVQQTARAHQLSFVDSAALDDRVTDPASTTVRLGIGGETIDLDTGDGTLQGLVTAVNNSGAGVQAGTVRLDDGTYRLRVTSKTTGQDAAFTLTNADGTDLLGGAAVTAGQDAKITVGGDTVSSATNSFKGVISGLDVAIAAGTAAGTVVDVTVSRDADSVATKVKALVDAANSVLSDIDTLTAFSAEENKSGILAGDSTVRSLRNALLSTVTTGANGGTLADVGIELDRYGKITFDQEAFTQAYAVDPEGTAAHFTAGSSWSGTGQVTMVGSTWRTAPGTYTIDATAGGGTINGTAATVSGGILSGAAGTAAEGLAFTTTGTATGTLTFSQGFAARLAAVAQRASDSHVGTVTQAVNGRTATVDDMNDAIENWDTRLEQRRSSLERQYAALEVALGKLQNQSSWLAGQIGSLPTNDAG